MLLDSFDFVDLLQSQKQKNACQILFFLGGKVELKFFRITMNITVINTKLLIVHVQKINTWTLKKWWFEFGRQISLSTYKKILVSMFFGAVTIQHWAFPLGVASSTLRNGGDFHGDDLALHHPFLESPTKQIQAIHFCGFQAINSLRIPC